MLQWTILQAARGYIMEHRHEPERIRALQDFLAPQLHEVHLLLDDLKKFDFETMDSTHVDWQMRRLFDDTWKVPKLNPPPQKEEDK
jgi:hypothetical protein